MNIALLCALGVLGWQENSGATRPQTPAVGKPDEKAAGKGQMPPMETIPTEEAMKLESKLLSNIKQVTDIGESGEGYFSPDGSKIIYQSIRGDHPFYQIFVRDLATGKEHLISTGAGRTTCAYFHPNKPKLLFASSHLDPDRDAVASKEREKQIATKKSGERRRNYEWSFDPHMDIFECDPDGTNLKRLTDEAGYDAEGSYSPDGSKIVYCSFKKGNKGDLWIMNADGSNKTQLTDNPGYDGGPFFSPDGKQIIYRAEAGKPDYLQLFVMNVDGTNRKQLTNNDSVNWGPYWHPSGKYVIFSTSIHGHYNYELYLMELATQKLERVTFMAGADVLPVFDATGKKMMWTSKRGKNQAGMLSSQLWMADWNRP